MFMRRIGLAVVRALSNVIRLRERVREIDLRPATTKVHRGGLVLNRRDYLKVVGVLAAAVTFGRYTSPGRAADPQPVTVLVTYHSATGNTEKMAQGVANGAKAVSGTRVVLKRVSDVAANDLSSSDALIVGSPVYFANMSGKSKPSSTIGR